MTISFDIACLVLLMLMNSSPCTRTLLTATATMKGNLTDLKMVHVGGGAVVEGQVYIVGTAPDGTLAGLETTRSWT